MVRAMIPLARSSFLVAGCLALAGCSHGVDGGGPAPVTDTTEPVAEIADRVDTSAEADVPGPEPADIGSPAPLDVGPPDPSDVPPPPDLPEPDVAPPPLDEGPDAGPAPVALTIAAFQAIVAGADSDGLAAFQSAWDGPICEAGSCLVVTEVDPGVIGVTIPGDHDDWAGQPMQALPFAPGVWWIVLELGTTFSVASEYKLRLDGQWTLDPANPYFRFDPFGTNSAIYAPGHGRLTVIEGVASPQLSNSRDVFVYLPAGYFVDAAAHFPVLYMQDGFNVFSNPLAPFGDWGVDVTIDALAAAGEIAPPIVVGIDTENRIDEYLYAPVQISEQLQATPLLPQYAAFVTETLKPLVDERWRTRPEPEHTAVAGSSLGGISALWIAWHHPGVFGRVASFSGSYWIGQDDPAVATMQALIAEPGGPSPADLRVYLDAGDSHFDGTTAYTGDSWVYTDWTRNALIGAGWSNRAAWDTDDDLATPPSDLPVSTPISGVPAIAWQAEAPAEGWAVFLGVDKDLCALVGHGHAHNEAAWKARFGAALRYLFPPGP